MVSVKITLVLFIVDTSAFVLHTTYSFKWFYNISGVNSGVGPLYLAEISPVSLRGLVGTLNQLAITLGVLVAEAIGLSIALGTDELWPLCVGKFYQMMDS